MTVLIAQNTKDKIILGADTGSFFGDYHKIHLTNHKSRLKIMSQNDITYCGTGLVSEIINFGLFCQTRKPERSDQAYMEMYLGKSVKEAIDLTVQMNIWASGEAQIVEIDKK